MSSMIQYSFPTSLPWTDKLISRLSVPAYRHAYMVEGVKTWIARQVRALREQRDWSQEDLGRRTGKPQSAISRVEDPDYGKLTLQTLFDLARAYDLPLLVQFVEWSDWLCRMDDSSSEALQKEAFSADALKDLGSRQVLIEPKYEEVVFDDPNWSVHIEAPMLMSPIGVAGTTLLTGATDTAITSTRGIGLPYAQYIDLHDRDLDHDRYFDDERLIRWPAYHLSNLAEADNG
jgi:transcriptional regulator with XRE-family HTH domain